MKRTPLKRYTPLRKVRPELRRGELTAEQKEAIRLEVYTECAGRCMLDNHEMHLSGRLPWDGSIYARWHLVHKKAKRVHGWDKSNLTGGCYWCHIVGVHTKGARIA